MTSRRTRPGLFKLRPAPGRLFALQCASAAAAAALLCAPRMAAAQPVDADVISPPRPSRVVVVFEENKSLGQIIGNPDAPYMNQLAADGMLFTNFFAITHPSQPNYLEFFSGSNQGTPNNSNPPPGTPFTTPNLASSLMDGGYSFIGYAEGLPWVGATVPNWMYYTRVTCPWVNWQADDPGHNQIAPTQNLPFTYFPSDFSLLPDVCMVIPDLTHNTHDGTIAEADQWLQANIGPFAAWAQENNGLLIITFDEDESLSGNRVPTIMYGPMVRQGTNNATWTLHNLTRTIHDFFMVTPAGITEHVSRIHGFTNSGGDTMNVFTFRNGLNGYGGTSDTYIEEDEADAAHGQQNGVTLTEVPRRRALIRFDGIIGPGPGQVPPGSHVLSAKMSVVTAVGSGFDTSADTMYLHRMIADWDESCTWNSLVDGISFDDVEAAAEPGFWLIPNVGLARAIFDVTADVQAWVNDPAANHGWAIRSDGWDVWRWRSSEHGVATDRPIMEIVIGPPPAPGGFAPISPGAGAVAQPARPTLTWSAANGATTYTVLIDDDADLSSPIHTAPGLTATSYDVPDAVLSMCRTYSWGVIASNESGDTPSTPSSISFETRRPADYNGDGFVDGIDYDLFNNDFENTDPVQQMNADYNGDGFVDGIDYDMFNNDFEGGC